MKLVLSTSRPRWLRAHTRPLCPHSQLPSTPSPHDDAAPLSPRGTPHCGLSRFAAVPYARPGPVSPLWLCVPTSAFPLLAPSHPPTAVPSRSSPYPSSPSMGDRTTSPTPPLTPRCPPSPPNTPPQALSSCPFSQLLPPSPRSPSGRQGEGRAARPRQLRRVGMATPGLCPPLRSRPP